METVFSKILNSYCLLIFVIFVANGCSGGFRAATNDGASLSQSSTTPNQPPLGTTPVCTPNAKQICQSGNGTGSQTCNSSGSAWGACGNLTRCNSGYTLSGGKCVAVPAQLCTANAQQSCKTGNGTGTQTCNSSGSAWGACGNLTRCNSGYTLSGGSCVALAPTASNGVCGSANGVAVPSAPTANLCNAGTASTVAGSGPFTWTCAGANGGTSASCSTPLQPVPVNGACGSSDGGQFSSPPTANLCVAGTTSSVSGSGPYSWTCTGSNGGSTATCQASYTPPPPASLTINLIWDSSVTSSPYSSQIQAAVTQAAQFFESRFNDRIIVNIQVSYGVFGGQPMPNLGSRSAASWSGGEYSYSQIVGMLKQSATTATDTSAYGYFPATAPASLPSQIILTSAQGKALGTVPATATGIDGYFALDSSTTSVNGGPYDAVGLSMHEISEILGRDSGFAFGGSLATVQDLFRYNNGALSFQATGYFSVNGGSSNLKNFNGSSPGDAGDWAPDYSNDACAAAVPPGQLVFSGTDLTEMDVIGFSYNGTP